MEDLIFKNELKPLLIPFIESHGIENLNAYVDSDAILNIYRGTFENRKVVAQFTTGYYDNEDISSN